MKRIIIFIISFLVISLIRAQTFLPVNAFGNTGLYFTPDAFTAEDRSFTAAYYSIPKGFTPYKNLQGKQVSVNSVFLNIGFLPFMEVSGRLTIPNRPSNIEQMKALGDRSTSVKFQLLKEKKNFPALALGISDLAANSKTTRGFHAIYLVGSKNFTLSEYLNIKLSLGYGDQLLEANRTILQGPFGSSQIIYKNISIFIEYDSENLNFGARLFFYGNRLGLTSALISGKHLSLGVFYSFLL